jgi:hypothetical protein
MMSKKYWDIKKKLTPKDYMRLSVLRHPHRQTLKYYPYRVGLIRQPNMNELIWLNKHTKGCYSVDNTIAPYNLSFEVKQDAMYFKLVWFDIIACQVHFG